MSTRFVDAILFKTNQRNILRPQNETLAVTRQINARLFQSKRVNYVLSKGNVDIEVFSEDIRSAILSEHREIRV